MNSRQFIMKALKRYPSHPLCYENRFQVSVKVQHFCQGYHLPTVFPQMRPLSALTTNPVRQFHALRSGQNEMVCGQTKAFSPMVKGSFEPAHFLANRSGKIQMEHFTTSNVLQDSKNSLGKQLKPVSSFDFFSLKSLLSTPFPFMAYGLGGLIPFMSVPAYMQWAGYYSPSLAQAQLVYGACILSFLGGVAWGHQLSKAEKVSLSSLSYGILLPLIAWPGVLLYPNPIGFGLVITGIVYAGLFDTQNLGYPLWFRNLRFLLSTLVVLSLTTTAIFRLSKTSSDSKTEEKLNE